TVRPRPQHRVVPPPPGRGAARIRAGGAPHHGRLLEDGRNARSGSSVRLDVQGLLVDHFGDACDVSPALAAPAGVAPPRNSAGLLRPRRALAGTTMTRRYSAFTSEMDH